MRFVDIFFQTFSTLRLAYPTAQINTQCLVAQRREVFLSPYWLKYVPKLVNTHKYCPSRRMNTQQETIIIIFKPPRLFRNRPDRSATEGVKVFPHCIAIGSPQTTSNPGLIQWIKLTNKNEETHTEAYMLLMAYTNIDDIDFLEKKIEGYRLHLVYLAAVFWMSRKNYGGALRDIQKTAAS